MGLNGTEMQEIEKPCDRRDQLFTRDDMLAAWVAGRNNLTRYGEDSGNSERNGDAPDFASWIRAYKSASTHTDHCQKRQLYGDGECECQLKE